MGMGMGWIVIAEESKEVKSNFPTERRVDIGELSTGDIFSLNTQARKFEFLNISAQPAGHQIAAKVINPDGSSGQEVALDYKAHQGLSVLVWGHQEVDDILNEFQLFERVRMKGSDVDGIVLDLDKSKFPECDIVVMWEQPIHGNAVTEVHAHEIESLKETMRGHDVYGSSDRNLSEMRNIILDLRGKHDQKFEDKTKQVIQQQVDAALKEHEEVVKKICEQDRQQIRKVCSDATQQFAPDFKRIADACVMAVSGGEYNYEIDYIGHILTNYADSVYHQASRLTSDPIVAHAAAREILNNIAQSALKSYFMTRLGSIRRQEGKWIVIAKSGKRVGSYPTKKSALHRLKESEYHSRHGETSNLESQEVAG
jgi:hypothetical protein